MMRGSSKEFFLYVLCLIKSKVVGVVQAMFYFFEEVGAIEVRHLRKERCPAENSEQAYGQ